MITLSFDLLALAALLTVAVLARRTSDVVEARRIGIVGSATAPGGSARRSRASD